MIRAFLLLLLMVYPAAAQITTTGAGGTFASTGVTITGVTLSNSTYGCGGPANQVIGTATVTTTGGAFTGTIAVTGTNASNYNLSANTSGSNFRTNAIVCTTADSVSITPTMAGAVNSGTPYTVSPVANGPGDVVSGGIHYYGVRAYTTAEAAAATQLLFRASRDTDTTHSCSFAVAATGNIGIASSCDTSGDNGSSWATWISGTVAHIGTFYDHIGGADCTQATRANQPQIDATGTITFTGSNSQSLSCTFSLAAVNQLSISFWLSQPTNGSTDALAMEYTANAGSNSGSFFLDPNSSSFAGAFEILAKSTTTSGGSHADRSFPQLAAGSLQHYVIQIDPTQATGAAQIPAAYGNAVAQTLTDHSTGSISAGAFTNSTLYLMSRGGASLFDTGTFMGLILFNRLLTSGDVSALFAQGGSQ